MRIKEKIENIDYNDTKLFFKKRAEKFQESNPYSVTMYRDNNEEIVRQRNKKEIEKLMPLLHMEKEAKVLDVTGVEPNFFIENEFQHVGLTKLIVTKDMSERKNKMIELGEAFIAFPGGTGTLEEIAEVMSKEIGRAHV